MKKTIYLLIICLIYALNSWANPDSLKFPEPEDSLLEAQVNAVVNAFKIQKAINDKNDREGKSYLNNYIIFPNPPDYIITEQYNNGLILWQMDSPEITKMGELLKTTNRERSDAGESEHYIIIASVYNYYYDVAYYDVKEGVYINDMPLAEMDWKNLMQEKGGFKETEKTDENIQKEYNELNPYSKKEEGYYSNTLTTITERKRDKERLNFITALTKSLNIPANPANISIAVTFYEWEFVKEGEEEKTRYTVRDYYRNLGESDGEFELSVGFNKFQEQKRIDNEPISREEGLLKLVELTLEYFDILEREFTEPSGDKNIVDDIKSPQGKHLVGLLIGWVAEQEIGLEYELSQDTKEKLKALGLWLNMIEDMSATGAKREDIRLQWAFYLGYLKSQYELGITFYDSEIQEDGSPGYVKLPQKELNTEQDFQKVVQKAQQDFIEYHNEFLSFLDLLKDEKGFGFDYGVFVFPEGYWKSFSIEERVKIINKLLIDFEAHTTDFNVANTAVSYIIKVFETTPDFQAKGFLEKMSEGGTYKKMVEVLYTGDDLWIGGDELEKPINVLFSLWLRAYSDQEIIAMAENASKFNKYAVYARSKETGLLESTSYEFLSNGFVSFETVSFKPPDRLTLVPTANIFGPKSSPIVISPNALIKLNYRYGGKWETDIVPAFIYIWLIEKDSHEAYNTSIELSVEAISLLTSLRGITTAKRFTQAFIAGVSLIASMNNIANITLKGIIIEEMEGGPAFVEKWNLVTNAVNIADIAGGGIDVAIDVVVNFKKVSQFKNKAPGDYTNMLDKHGKIKKQVDKIISLKVAAPSNQITKQLEEGKIVFNVQDNILDVYVHYDTKQRSYVAHLDGDEIILNERLLADVINKKLTDNITSIRLLSCSDWKSSKQLAKYIDQDLPITASNKPVDLYLDADNNITAIDGGDWKKFSKTKEEDFSPTWDNKPNSGGKGSVIRMGVSFSDPDVANYVRVITSSWNNEYKTAFQKALLGSLFDKINGAKGSKLYSKYERVSFEIMDWARREFFPNNRGWATFATEDGRRPFFRAWRYVLFMDMNPNHINISLGLANGVELSRSAKKLKSTYYGDFYTRGFIKTDGIVGENNLSIWFPLVAQTIKKSYDNGGKIYFHMDGIDIDALYDLNHVDFDGGTMTELRYLIDNGLIEKGRVEFRLGDDILPQSQQIQLNNAIERHKNNVNTLPKNEYGSWKGMYDINYE